MSAVARPAPPTLAAYDELPYDSQPLPQTHPSRLSTLARLFGLAPPAIETCRVLELGCANGNNLIPMAAALPGARFVGVDLSARQIADGRALIADAGLDNIELRHADIMSISPRDGEFDYIIAHGVYSWVPPEVREKVLAICSENLARDGVAYVSYNTYPGWGINGVLREMMMYQARGTAGLQARARKGRAMLDLLAQAMPNTPYGALVREEIEYLKDVPDGYVSHDHLEGCNDPVYFHQFAEAAGRHRLQYLAEAEFSTMGLGGIPQPALAAMRAMSSDIVAFEQLTDVLRCRAHRQTLLVHADAPVDRRLGSHSIRPFSISTPATIAPAEAAKPPTANIAFTAPNGSAFGVANPLTRAALLLLIERSPEKVPFGELHQAAASLLRGAERLPSVGEPGIDVFAGEMLQLYAAGIVQLRTWDPGVTARVSERPEASPLARLVAQRRPEIASQLHQSVALDPAERTLVGLLDGSRDVDALADAMTNAGALSAAPVPGMPPLRTADDRVRHMLRQLARVGVLAKGFVISLAPDLLDIVPLIV
jgi:SAM-dependent methyltransferase